MSILIYLYKKNMTTQERKEYNKRWREANKEKIRVYKKQYRQDNKEKIKEEGRVYNVLNKKSISEKKRKYYELNKTKINKSHKEYQRKNPESIKAYKKKWEQSDYAKQKKKEYWNKNKHILKPQIYKRRKERMKSDTLFKLKENIKSAIYNSFYRNGFSKNSKTAKILGCTFSEFKSYIEKQFKPWMNWDKHGLYNGELNYGFDIDHIIPISLAKTEKELIKLNHYTNFQPLCSYTNRYIKGAKLLS
jgi:hypothetical protein